MYCTKCGTYMADDHQFCINCGAPRPVLPPSKKGTRWIPILLLVLMTVIGSAVYYISTTALAQPWFSVDNGTLSFDERKYAGSEELTVPDTVDGQTVTGVGAYCFQYCDSLTAVTLPGTVKIIEPYAFFDCENLQTIELSYGTQIIDYQAFFSCDSLESIYIPSSVETIDSGAFEDCSSLAHIYYEGTAEDWACIYYGEIAPNIQIHYVSTT